MTRRTDYFARVRPLLGDGLSRKTIAIQNLSACGRIIEMLAACMLQRVVVTNPAEPIAWPLVAACRGHEKPAPGMTALAYLKRHLRWKNQYANVRWLNRAHADLTLVAELVEPGTSPSLEWNAGLRRLTLRIVRGDYWSYVDLVSVAAREVRDVLIGRMPWPGGTRYVGSRDWPFAVSPRPMAPPARRPANLAGKHVMVIGTGSVGSELVRHLATSGCRWTLVDPGKVSIFNPHRQWFGTSDVGRSKVEVLAERLTAAAPANAAEPGTPIRAVAARFGEQNLGELGELLMADRPDAVVLTTGTSDDAALAEMFWRHRIPYVAAYAYPQARYFEVTVASPQDLTPCLHCFRGHLYKGIEAAQPMTDEVASFLYREPSAAERDRLYVNLVAEPATPMETSRIADVAARLLTELTSPRETRSDWFRKMLAEGTTCLLGANVVETRDGEPVYGMTFAGQVVRLGLGDLVGAEAQRVCGVCGRELAVTHRVELPRAADADVDAAMLG